MRTQITIVLVLAMMLIVAGMLTGVGHRAELNMRSLIIAISFGLMGSLCMNIVITFWKRKR